jgi:hypothetical protein
MSIDASGAFADTMVYAKWKGINYSRQYAIPAETLNLVLHMAILAPDSIKISLNGRPPEIGLLSLCESEIRSQTPIWLQGISCFLANRS